MRTSLRGPRPRLLTTTLAVTALSMALAACGAGQDTSSAAGGGGSKAASGPCDLDAPSASTTVNVLGYTSPGIDPFSNAMVACSTGNLSVKHGEVDFSGQLTKADLSLSAAKPSYDVIEVYTSTLNQYADKGWIEPLDDFYAQYKSRYKLDDIDPGLLDKFRYKGKLYGLPMQVNVHAMAYRKDIFDKLGLSAPKTWDELLAALQKIKDANVVRYPLAMPLSASTYVSSGWFNSLKSVGGRAIAEGTTTPQFTSPQAKQAVESLQKLLPFMSPSAVNSDETSATTALQNGQSAVELTYSGDLGQLLDTKSTKFASNFAFAPPPSVVPGGQPWATVYIDGWAIAKNSAVDKKLLFQVIAAGAGAGATKAAGALVYPARTSVLKDPTLSASPTTGYWPAVTQTLAGGATGPQPEPYFGAFLSAARPGLADAVFGKKPVDQALAEAQKLGEDYIAKNVK